MVLTKSCLSAPLESAVSFAHAPFNHARFVGSCLVMTGVSFVEAIIGEMRENAAKAIITGVYFRTD